MIVVGGGAAGRAVALTLGRALRRVLVIDSGRARNDCAGAVHNYATRDGESPGRMRELGFAELRAYSTVEVREGAVAHVTGDLAEGFGVGGERGRRVVLASGVEDVLPDVPGVAELWGRGVYHCVYCHGFEVRGQRLGVLGAGRGDVARHLTRFSADVTWCGDGSEVPRIPGVRGVRERVAGVGRGWVEFVGGGRVGCDALFLRAGVRQRSDVPGLLGCAFLEDGRVRVDELFRTSVGGVYAVGDMAGRAGVPSVGAVIVSAASGMVAGGVVDMDLLREDAG
ncbi:NAD(P)/FAD-dependent oxidoreductase [Nonomuraea sp. NBC_01738]|nr:NAD(P)/FAD-dependent oxidoreductase [Nonomuraea sp. NBC_01738]